MNKTQYFRLWLYWLLFWCTSAHCLLSAFSLSALWLLSECFLSAFWVLSECSLSVHWLLTDCSLTADLFLTDCLKIWARMIKIDCSRAYCAGRTDTHCDSLGSLTEPKTKEIFWLGWQTFNGKLFCWRWQGFLRILQFYVGFYRQYGHEGLVLRYQLSYPGGS